MPKKTKKRVAAKVATSGRCSHIVHYTTYPFAGIRTERKGRCSRWTIFSCGFCPMHDKLHCKYHRIMWLVAETTRRKRA